MNNHIEVESELTIFVKKREQVEKEVIHNEQQQHDVDTSAFPSSTSTRR
ncbi:MULTISPECIES: hypothetical protein [unclassified Sporosarcina]|nr:MULTISPECIES: hypothetical protein [unclassified Sporosarcina]